MKTQDFEVWLNRKTVKCRSLRECQRELIKYRDEGLLGASQFYANDGRVHRNGVKVGWLSYNGRFWRYDR